MFRCVCVLLPALLVILLQVSPKPLQDGEGAKDLDYDDHALKVVNAARTGCIQHKFGGQCNRWIEKEHSSAGRHFDHCAHPVDRRRSNATARSDQVGHWLASRGEPVCGQRGAV